MSLDETTQAERDFFASRGRNTDALIAENPDLKHERVTDETPVRDAPDTGAGTQQREQREGEGRGPVHIPERQPSQPTVSGAQPESSEARSGPIPDDQDEPGPGGHPKRVTWNKYKQLMDERETWIAERQAYTDRMARLDERLKLINEAMTPQEQEEQPPDPTQDAYGFMQWQEQQRRNDRAQFEQFMRQQAERDVENQIQEAYKADAARFAAQVPQFGAAYYYVINNRDAQLQNMEPWLSPQDRAAVIRQEELNGVRNAIEHGLSPAERIYQQARLWGFDGWYAYQQEQARQRQETPGAVTTGSPPGANGAAGGAQPAAPQPNGGQQNTGAPSAVQRVEAVVAGQAASRSLSQAGGGNPVQPFSARDLADMSEEEFNAVFSRLQGTGNKARLRELMGA
jgi:hypothetical protein